MNSVQKVNFEKVIDKLAENKVIQKELETTIKNQSTFVKSTLNELELEEYSTDKYRAYIQISNKVSMDEDKLIEILKANCKEKDLKNVIKTKQYIDFDALESFIYNGGIAAEKLEPAQTIKVIQSLYTKPIKKEKKDA